VGEQRSAALHLASFTSHEFEKLLDRPDARLWVAQIDGLIVGFLTMIIGSANPITGTPRGAEIARIYLLGVAPKRPDMLRFEIAS